jgi:hypothetical protein
MTDIAPDQEDHAGYRLDDGQGLQSHVLGVRSGLRFAPGYGNTRSAAVRTAVINRSDWCHTLPVTLSQEKAPIGATITQPKDRTLKITEYGVILATCGDT